MMAQDYLDVREMKSSMMIVCGCLCFDRVQELVDFSVDFSNPRESLLKVLIPLCFFLNSDMIVLFQHDYFLLPLFVDRERRIWPVELPFRAPAPSVTALFINDVGKAMNQRLAMHETKDMPCALFVQMSKLLLNTLNSRRVSDK